MDFEIGQIVFSKRGRDKGLPFIILDIEANYLYLVDGKLRTIKKPKRKKDIHVQYTKYVSMDIKEKVINNKNILDSDIRKEIVRLLKN